MDGQESQVYTYSAQVVILDRYCGKNMFRLTMNIYPTEKEIEFEVARYQLDTIMKKIIESRSVTRKSEDNTNSEEKK